MSEQRLRDQVLAELLTVAIAAAERAHRGDVAAALMTAKADLLKRTWTEAFAASARVEAFGSARPR